MNSNYGVFVRGKNLNIKYHLVFVKYEISFEEFKNELSLEEFVSVN